MKDLSEIIFGEKKFSEILEEIYQNQKKKKRQIETLINELKPLIKDIGDATVVVPLLKEYLDIGVKNDDILIKLANLIQKIIQNREGKEESDFSLTEEEKSQLLEELEKLDQKNNEV
jgi:hypothetical protein